MMRIELDDNERKILETLARSGATSPSALAAETLTMPADIDAMLRTLNDMGLVLMRDDADSADGKLIAISAEARDLIGSGSAAQIKR